MVSSALPLPFTPTTTSCRAGAIFKFEMCQSAPRHPVYGPKRGEVKAEWRRAHNGEVYDLYISLDIIQVIKSVSRNSDKTLELPLVPPGGSCLNRMNYAYLFIIK
jgi:hypothetical protein